MINKQIIYNTFNDQVQEIIEQRGTLEIFLDDLILATNIGLIDLWNALLYIKDSKLPELNIETRKPKISKEKIEIKTSKLELV